MKTVLMCLGLAGVGFCVGSHWSAPLWAIVVLWVVGIALWVLVEWLERRARDQ